MTNENTNTQATSETLAKLAIALCDKSESIYGAAQKVAIATLLQANSDVQLEDGIMIGDYYLYDTKLQKMNWRNEVFTKIFNFTSIKDVTDAHKKLVERVLPIVTVLIREGYTLVTTDSHKKLDYNSLSDDRKIVLDTKNYNLYLPKCLAIASDSEGVLSPFDLTLVTNSIASCASRAMALLGKEATTTRNRVVNVPVPSDVNEIDVDELNGAKVQSQKKESTNDTQEMRIHTLLSATLNVCKMRTLTEFTKAERKMLYSIAQVIVSQLDDDAKIALLQATQYQPTTTDESNQHDETNVKREVA